MPQELGYQVGDIEIGGRKIEFGGQIADHVRMKLTALAIGFGSADIAPMTGCRRLRQTQPSFDEAVEVLSTDAGRIGAIQNHR